MDLIIEGYLGLIRMHIAIGQAAPFSLEEIGACFRLTRERVLCLVRSG